MTYQVFPAKALASHVPATQPTEGVATVSLVVHDSSVKFVVNDILRQAHLRPWYNSSASAFAKRITVKLTNVNAMDALAIALRGTGLVAKLASDGETVIIREGKKEGHVEHGGSGIVIGRVTDSASGRGLRGATIRIEGTKLSIPTSDNGNFTLHGVPEGTQVVSVKLFGYRPTERTVTVVDSQQTMMIRFVLVPVPTVLSGVVTTAAGQQQRYQVGNDITVLHADSIQQIAPVSTITQMLETRVPGLIVQHTSGIPGAPSRLRLRGLSSINMSADPILIIDGVRIYADQSKSLSPNSSSQNGSSGGGTETGGGAEISGGNGQLGSFSGPSALDQLDPNAVETIEVLKGPSATAIYGSDAANGVIIVTTKRGRIGPTRWTLSLDQGRTTLPGSWPTNYYVFGHRPFSLSTNLPTFCIMSDILDAICAIDSVIAYQALNNPGLSPLTGQAGVNHDASLTVSGGSGLLTYAITGTATAQSGYLHLPPDVVTAFRLAHGFAAPNWMRTPDQYSTYGVTGTVTAQLGASGGAISFTSGLLRSAQQQSSLQSDLQQLASTYVDTSKSSHVPPFGDFYQRVQFNATTFTNVVTLTNWVPWNWFPSITATAGLNVQDNNNNSLTPRDYAICLTQSGAYCNGSVGGSGQGGDSIGAFSLVKGTNTSGSLTMGTNFNQRWVSTALGLNVYTVAQSSISAQTTGLPLGGSEPDVLQYTCGSGGTCGPSYSTVNQATYGWYVQPTLNLHERFFVSPGFRLDGGSNAGSNSGTRGSALSLFPKLDFSWIAVNRTSSDPLFGALTLLRPRIAFGIAGVQPAPGQRLRLLQPAQVSFLTSDGPGTPVDVLSLQTLGNPNLHPERDREVEGGVDAEFWNQRLAVTLTGYTKTAFDAILSVPVAPSALPLVSLDNDVNVGTIRNSGVEATVFARILDSRAVDWSINANLSHNQNRLVSLAPGILPLTTQGNSNVTGGVGYSTRLVPGYPLFGLWAQPIVGFADINHDGLIEPNEVVVADSARYVGAQQPNYETTVSTTLRFFNGRISVNTSVDYQNGLTQSINNQAALDGQYYSGALSPAAQAALVGVVDGGVDVGKGHSSAIGFLQTVNTLRWNSLSVTFLAPSRLTQLVHVPSLSLSLQGSNLGLHTNYRGIDPNVNVFSSGNLTQDTGGLLPSPRIWSLRLTLGG